MLEKHKVIFCWNFDLHENLIFFQRVFLIFFFINSEKREKLNKFSRISIKL
jgi:hypothetical protein